MKLSVVTTLYRSASFIEEFYRRASDAARGITDDYEIVMVDDGSPDNSLDIACALTRTDPKVKVVELSRNFGHHKALMTGLDHATGELCFLIDSDLEEDPGSLEEFYRTLSAGDLDVVFGFQEQRKGTWYERLGGKIAYWLFDLFLPFKIPHSHITVRLMRRGYVDALLLHRERETVIGGLWVIAGFKQAGIPVKKITRPGRPTYGIIRRWAALIDSIVAFSETPLVVIFYFGILISTISAAISAVLLFQKFFLDRILEGWVSVMLSLWFIGGLLIFCVGLIGIYISKIFIETKNRPYTIVRRLHESSDRSD